MHLSFKSLLLTVGGDSSSLLYVPIGLDEEGLLGPLISNRVEWCKTNTKHGFAATYECERSPIGSGFWMVFEDPTDAMLFKVFW